MLGFSDTNKVTYTLVAETVALCIWPFLTKFCGWLLTELCELDKTNIWLQKIDVVLSFTKKNCSALANYLSYKAQPKKGNLIYLQCSSSDNLSKQAT